MGDVVYTYDDEAAAGSRTASATGYVGAGGAVAIPDTVPLSVFGGGTETYTVTAIGDLAFDQKLLTSVTIPDSVTAIGSGAFSVNALTSVTVPDSVITIGSGAFYDNDLTSVTIGNSVTTIGDDAFGANALTSLALGNSIVTIGLQAFAGNSLTSVTIPDSVITIGEGAFVLNALTSVTIGNSVTSIGLAAFAANDLTSVTIPASVATIGAFAFYINPALDSVTFNGNAPVITPAGPTGSFGEAAGKTVYYNSGAGIHPGATPFSTPTWEGYNTWISGTIAPVIQTATLPAATVGTAYSQMLTATGAPTPTFAVTAGSLPAGLTLSAAGVISGTPTAQGTATFTITATNVAGTDSRAFTLVIDPAAPVTVVPSISTPAALPAATVGTAYSQTLSATGTPAPTFAVTAGSLPAGLTLSASGLLSGTPTAVGTATFTVTATNAAGTDARQFTITVAAATVTPTPTPSDTGAKLSSTGAESNGVFGAAALLLLGAGAILLTARGLRRAHAQR